MSPMTRYRSEEQDTLDNMAQNEPNPLVDQIEAAARQVSEALDAVGLTRQPHNNMLGSLLEAMSKAQIERWVKAGMPTCRHLAIIPTAPIFMVFRGNMAMCSLCYGLYGEQIEDTDEDRTCDVCLRVVPIIRTVVAAAGSISVHGGVCSDCFRDSEDSA
jgi:hypothetical protein